jgi:hypothetical protein
MGAAGFLTLALNSAPSAIHGWASGDPKAWGRAVVEAIVPFLLIAWSHVGPKLIGLYVEVRADHNAKIAEALRIAEQASVEAAGRRRAEVEEAIAEALSGASAEYDALLAEEAARRVFVESTAASAEAELRASAASVEAELRASVEAATQRLRFVEAERDRLREAAKAKSRSAPRGVTQPTPRTSVESASKPPRRSAAELLEERVEAAKEALPTWQLETPSGPEIRSAIGIKSDGVISDIRKRLEADRLAVDSTETRQTADDEEERAAS